MPSKKFNLLSEREREYLENPDNFDSQTAAEIRYRLRTKWEEIEKDTTLLKNNLDKWTKDQISDVIVIVCGECENRTWTIETKPSHANFQNRSDIEIPDGWVIPQKSGKQWVHPQEIKEYFGEDDDYSNLPIDVGNESVFDQLYSLLDYCDNSISKKHGYCPNHGDKSIVIKKAKKTGRVKCRNDDCNTHRIGSEPYEDHRRYIPLSDSTIEEIKAERVNHD
ncbi:hypothetical protein SAMN06266787_10694 [Halorubrum ezzemoulense]|uniref:Uncharacterized protein n=1 Tax=Halorubrum ezzemoulense TaxID=337243 RepID=A0A238XRH9_HALEZ|nr:hypothetical protein [Halorubrum ezzemoulense]SNR61595.1 hypothetical protein SAMN06266787_10694 [Halorubrum ezzemoulense]